MTDIFSLNILDEDLAFQLWFSFGLNLGLYTTETNSDGYKEYYKNILKSSNDVMIINADTYQVGIRKI